MYYRNSKSAAKIQNFRIWETGNIDIDTHIFMGRQEQYGYWKIFSCFLPLPASPKGEESTAGVEL